MLYLEHRTEMNEKPHICYNISFAFPILRSNIIFAYMRFAYPLIFNKYLGSVFVFQLRLKEIKAIIFTGN